MIRPALTLSAIYTTVYQLVTVVHEAQEYSTYLNDLWTSSNACTWNDAAVLGYRSSFNHSNVETIVLLMLRIVPIHKVYRKHAQVL